MARYETLSDLREAFADGQLPGKKLMLDNDTTDMWDHDAPGPLLFTMHPAELLEQALTLLGIPWERV